MWCTGVVALCFAIQAVEGRLVSHGVCRPLDDLKATYDALPDLLTQVGVVAARQCAAHYRPVSEYIATLPEYIATLPGHFRIRVVA